MVIVVNIGVVVILFKNQFRHANVAAAAATAALSLVHPFIAPSDGPTFAVIVELRTQSP